MIYYETQQSNHPNNTDWNHSFYNKLIRHPFRLLLNTWERIPNNRNISYVDGVIDLENS